MFPGYRKMLDAIALKGVLVQVDTPSPYLGVAPFETMENVEGNQFAMTRLELVRTVDGSTIPDGSYFGLPGYGSMVPEIDTSNDAAPYFGPALGGF